MVKNSVLKNPFSRNVLILSIFIAIALVFYNTFLIAPSFTRLLINATESDVIRITRLASSMLNLEGTEIGKDSLDVSLLRKEIDKIKGNFGLINFKAFSPLGEIVFSADQNEV